ncbi:GNAT family N-acetyltransferase [Streptomyces sp. SCSIO 30461]|uniref:GNAT family N-acetyltransferase n=1 Tax=Streptomyces sp. SCSIO 30461 TaxID=3118085 RepID=UPI0030D0EB75
MTTTLRPSGPLQQDDRGSRSRTYDVCVNSRRVGSVELGTHPALGPTVGVLRSLAIDSGDRRRGRGTVAALAAEEVLRDWGCTRVSTSVPTEATAVARLVAALGYTEESRHMIKELTGASLPEPTAGAEGRPMGEAEFLDWSAAELEGYTQTLVGQGVPPEQASARAAADQRRLLPEGLATPRTWIRTMEAEGAVVGHLWVAEREVRPGRQGAYVYAVEVAEPYRGRGHGRALMLLAERIARSEAGADLLGLRVRAGATPALRLYESLGYRVTHIEVGKQLL